VGLFDRKSKSDQQRAANSTSQYAGMRVEVMNTLDQMIFVGRMSSPWEGGLEITPITVPELDRIHEYDVNMRGYQESAQKAVHMRGRLTASGANAWRVKNFEVTGRENDRAFYRQEMAADGDITPFRGTNPYAMPCKVLNVSAGGVCIQVDETFRRGDKLLLRSDIFEGKTLPPLVCTVRRVTKRRIGYEYGCEFADLTPATEDMIAKAIMEIQLKRMRRE